MAPFCSLRSLRCLTALVVFCGSLAAAPAGATVTTQVIVELAGEPGAVWKARRERQGQGVSESALTTYRGQLRGAQDALLARVAAAGIPAVIGRVGVPGPSGALVAIEKRFTLVYNGVSLDVPVSDVVRLGEVAGVKAVHRVRVLSTALDRSVPFIRAPQLYGGVAELGPFDDLREGFEGQGIHIAVIDSGIEWQHEMFGGDPTPPRHGLAPSVALAPTNKKVIYNLALVDALVEDGLGHGTHVASTAAGYLGLEPGADGVPGNGDDVALHGVAPQARLMSYKICSDIVSTPAALGASPLGGCLNDLTILSLEDAVSPRTLTGQPKPVAHVINLSLGGTFGTPDDPTAVAASNAALMGAVVVAAAGNSGDVPGIVGSPSTGRHVISVANATDPGSAANWFVDALLAGGRTDVVVFPMAGTTAPPAGGLEGRFAYVESSLTFADYPASVAGNIALIRQGEAVGLFAETANNAALAGATAALLISDVENATAVRASIPAATIRPADADYLLALIGPAPQHGDVSAVSLRLKGSVSAFLTAMNGSTSRGPVAGLGQIKPDLTGPGTNILAAVPPASLLGAVTTSDGLTYGAVSGTSMSSPHVAGAAALVRQANPGWTPDMVRTALINRSTPMRDAAGVATAFGTHNPNLHSQGGGYVDTAGAARAKALLGVAGDGVDRPGILGSHSFGASPVIGNQCTNSRSVAAVIRDLRGTGGTYNLSVANNRELERVGVSASVTPAQVVVPANGSAPVIARLDLDGAQVDEGSQLDVQWFIFADRADGSERLSMPLFLRATPSEPLGSGEPEVETEVIHGTLGLGSSAAGVGEQSVDVPVEVPAGTFRLVGLLESDEVTNVAYPDLDLEVYDPNGNPVDDSGTPGGVETIDAPVTISGTYIFRVVNYINAGSSFTLTVDKHLRSAGAGPATLAEIATEYVEQDGDAVDFDGSFGLSWTSPAGATGFRVERSADGRPWETLAEVAASTTTLALTDEPDGAHAFRVLAKFPGVLCTYVAPASNVETVQVDRRVAADVTPTVTPAVTRAALADGVFEVDVTLTNDGPEALLNPIRLEVVGINGPSDVRAINADNGAGGTSNADAAVYDYSAQVGAETLAPGETSAARTLRFADPSSEMFSFEVRVIAHQPAP